ncbi:MAG: VCBS repeat-containing protein [Chitinophagaceae bacterium]|nr:VCBS repeat-containing protein [Chitinophagaceae bacterium]
MLKVPGFYLLLFFICLFLSCDRTEHNNPNALFSLLTPAETGISFNNEVKDTKKLNIFNFRNFYNGAGVSIGDINNDGLPDIFFTANQSKNKLYVNKGNWKFEDVTDAAGIKNLNKWYTGVTMADVNGDGWLDIYVCNSGGLVGYNHPNELYINQKNGTFAEEAAKYGLDDKGLTTHAAFFDYDHDGDLDCFVLNNSPRSIESFGYNKSIRNIRDKVNGDRFYRNDNGKFSDVSEEAGIYGSEIGFGLGITVGDLNNDGWEDMYISNDFFERDYLYINQHNGTFKEVINEAMGHISQGSMGSDMVDINNDGLLDVFTTEMLPEDDYKLKTTIKFDDYDVQNARLQGDFHHQFTSNCLQLNNGDGTFSEIAQLAGVDATGWSWGALSFDFDNDGLKDLYVCNGISKDLTDQDFLEFFGSNEVLNNVKEGGFNFEDILKRMPSNKISNYAFVNRGNLQFKNLADSLGLATPSFSNGAAYGDLDNDGDLDIVVNNANANAFVYRNNAADRLKNHFLKVKLKGNSPNTAGIGSRITLFAKSGKQILEQMPSRGFQSSIDLTLHFGVGDNSVIDSILVRWPDQTGQLIENIKTDTTIVFEQRNAKRVAPDPVKNELKPLFEDVTSSVIKGTITHRENPFIDFDVERLIPKMLSTEGPCLAVADINNDGINDFFLGSSVSDTGKIFIQNAAGKFQQISQPAFVADKYFETTAAVFFDVDNDKDEDLLLGSGGNQVKANSPYLNLRLYKNDGKGNFLRDTSFIPRLAVNASCIVLTDIDGDKKQDIFIGARCVPGTYGILPSSVLLKNNGNGTFSDVTKTHAQVLEGLGMVTDAKSADIDKDGREELIIVGDWMPVTVMKFENGVMKKSFEIENSNGWWNCVEINDVDGDGDMDLLAGNAGLNSRIKGTADKPAKLYVGDFDSNGQVECVPVYYKTDGKPYPYFMKGELQSQVPALKKVFLYFRDYAGKPIEEIFTEDQLKNISVLEVNETRTCLFRNDGKGYFTKEALPGEAQLSYVFAACVDDLDGDRKKDIFLAGNFYGLKPQAGRFDASYGTTLLGGTKYVTPAESGLFVNGEVRDITMVGEYIVVAVNNQPLKIFKRANKF